MSLISYHMSTCTFVSLFVCVSALAASLDHPAREARVGDCKNKTTTTRGGQEDTAGSARRITSRGTHADNIHSERNVEDNFTLRSTKRTCCRLLLYPVLCYVNYNSSCTYKSTIIYPSDNNLINI